jgi:hypothetical protein
MVEATFSVDRGGQAGKHSSVRNFDLTDLTVASPPPLMYIVPVRMTAKEACPQVTLDYTA